jgi:glycosyltransferase involved in cell wall biosynthesis
LGYVSDEELKYCYAQCRAFVYPSLFEGFGLTVLEAMACGSPVISSNATSIPEVAGDAALLVDPLNSEEIAKAMIRISQDEKLRAQLIQKGRLRAEQMKWENAVNQTKMIYNKIIIK